MAGKKRGLVICNDCGKLIAVSVTYARKKVTVCVSCALKRRDLERKLKVEVTCPNCFKVFEVSEAVFKANNNDFFLVCDDCSTKEKEALIMPCGLPIVERKSGRCSEWGVCEHASHCLDVVCKRGWGGFRRERNS